MTENTTDNKRIAKNTLLLYTRMFFIMCIQLYTSRVVLQALGVEDYGIYNVVGGIVTMFTFLNTALNSSTQRYITYYLGKGNTIELREVFSNCIIIHAIVAIIIVFLSETIGLWFLFNKMVIPAERMGAAMWVYQLSIITTIILIFSTPYNAAIIAYEKMSAFAYISVVEVLLRLLTAFSLIFFSGDKLILYAILTVVAQLIVRYIYVRYCGRKFDTTRIIYKANARLIKKMASFMGWNVFGGLSNVLYGQGLNILLNMFFGPVVNAARGVAVQVQTVVRQFADNLQTAFRPQITITYATDDLISMHDLIFRCSRYTFFLLLLVSFPIFVEAELLLDLWLAETPEWTVTFLRIMLCIVIVDSVASPLMTASAATGDVKLYQLVIGGTMLLIVPVSYLLLCDGFNPSVVFIVHLLFCLVTFALRLFIVRPMIKLSIRKYIVKVIVPCIKVFVLSILIPVFFFPVLHGALIGGVFLIIISCLSVALSIYFGGLSNNERAFINNKMKIIIKKNVIR